MRRTNPCILLLLSMVLLLSATATGEPIIRGFQLSALTGKSVGAPVPADKGVILAHIFNGDPLPLEHGKYEIGLELRGGSKPRTFVVKPARTILSGEMRTFRLQIPRTDLEKNSVFRVFSRVDGKALFSEEYPLGGAPSGANQVTTLYTEAPPEPDSIRPPKEVPFEGERDASPIATTRHAKPAVLPAASAAPGKIGAKSSAAPLAATPVSAPVPVPAPAPIHAPAHASTPLPAAAPAPAPTSAKSDEHPRSIDPAEFKSLRTIDEELVIYVVKKGDSLGNVALKYYGDAAKGKKIMDLNFIDNPQTVRVGEEIIVDVKPLEKTSSVVPNGVSKHTKKSSAKLQSNAKAATSNGAKNLAPDASGTSGASGASDASESASGKSSYVIQPGDSLGKIAKKFFGKTTKTSLILQANPGLNPKNLKVGTTIEIPSGKGEKA